MKDLICPRCGAEITARVCEYCGCDNNIRIVTPVDAALIRADYRFMPAYMTRREERLPGEIGELNGERIIEKEPSL